MKLGLLRDIRLFKIRWRRRQRSNQKNRGRKIAKAENLLFSRASINGELKKELCSMHEIGHMVLLRYLVPTENITARIWKNSDGEWEGSTEPDKNPDTSDYLAKTFVAGFLAEQMACRLLSKLSYRECYDIFRSIIETRSDYVGFSKYYSSQFSAEKSSVSEFEYYIAIHEEVYSYFIKFGIKNMYNSSRILNDCGQIKYTDIVGKHNTGFREKTETNLE